MPETSTSPAHPTPLRIAILGTVGVPGNYGGFETLAENLATYHDQSGHRSCLTVYCSGPAFADKSPYYRKAKRRFLPLGANGVSSILYDALSMFDAVLRRQNRLLLLGVSGALALPLLRLVPGIRIITNIDGIEWRRAKWSGLASTILRWSEWVAVRFSHQIIADNQAIAHYVQERYQRACQVIAYGGDHALEVKGNDAGLSGLPARYALALCRIEPENNVAMILDAFSKIGTPLVFVGNWGKSEYGRSLRAQYEQCQTIVLHDAVYEPAMLRAIRDRAMMYVHGHSAGGTNPSLVEMMHFGIPVLAFDCNFNRFSTDDCARYFKDAVTLSALARHMADEAGNEVGKKMHEIANIRYTWEEIGKSYFDLIQ